MKNLLAWLKDDSEKGQGMVEYGLILALIAVVVIALLTGIGENLKGIFTRVQGALTGAGAE